MRERQASDPVAVTASHCTRDTRLCSATDEMPAWQAFQFSAVPRTTTYFLLPFPALARLAERIGWSQTSPYEIVRRRIVRLCALNAPTLASLTEGGGAEPAR